MKNTGIPRALLLIFIGFALSAYSLLAMNSFLRTARPVLMMGSNMQPGGAMVQSIGAIVFLAVLLIAGAILILISIKRIIASFKK
jgi:hypothetical protein